MRKADAGVQVPESTISQSVQELWAKAKVTIDHVVSGTARNTIMYVCFMYFFIHVTATKPSSNDTLLPGKPVRLTGGEDYAIKLFRA